jgi:hypothetical protein
MFRIKTIAGAGLVVIALAAFGASAPMAFAKACKSPLECYGVLLAPGLVNPIPEPDPWSLLSEKAVEFTGGTLVVNCPQGELTGQIESAKGNLQGSITGATFGGAGGTPCGSSMGPAVVAADPQPLPWLLKTNGKSTGGPLSLTLGLDEAGLFCKYAAKSIKGTYNTDEEQPIVIGTKPPKFTGQEGSSPACPKKLTMSSNMWDVKASAPAGGEFPVVYVG